jgi:hypothetical protein
MTLLPQFKYDYFISYALVDDEKAAGVQTGWVSNFILSLECELGKATGRRGQLEGFWDRADIAKNRPLETQIRDALRSTAVFVLVLSPGYLNSPWCPQELQWFRDAVTTQPRADSRIFVVDLGSVTEAERRRRFEGYLSYSFYESGHDGRRRVLGYPEPDPKRHPAYYDSVTTLTREISEELQALRTAVDVAGAAGSGGSKSGVAADRLSAGGSNGHDAQPLTVFLAEVSDDLQKQRLQVQQYLEDNQYRVLRVKARPATAIEWQRQAEPLLQQSDAFVQLLGMSPGWEFEDSADGLVQQQSRLADSVQQSRVGQQPLQILQWRSGTLLTQLSEYPELRQLAEAPRVIAGPLEEFKAEIKRLVVRPEPKSQRPSHAEVAGGDVMPIVFINAGAEDLPQAEQLLQRLSDLNCLPQTPLLEGNPDDIRKELDAGLLESDGLIYFYGQISAEWLRRQFRTLPAMLPRRAQQQPPRSRPMVAICYGEPPGKAGPGVAFPGLQTIDLLKPESVQQLHDWVRALQMLRAGGAT